ncbi:MAG: adenine nucleotide alpha hydrolase [Acidobacteriia bacterium]|nr:adenine nucleotide alpha hydrolase [Terriglobia bacterium]
MKEKILLSWSGGKDSAYSLFELQRSGRYEIAALITTVTEKYDRISMHGVRRTLLEQQAASLGIPLEIVWITPQADNREYESKMQALLEKYSQRGIQSVAFGDIFLEDLRQYRETNLAKIGMRGIFPIWKRNTHDLAESFFAAGFHTVISCVDSKALDGTFVGREFDAAFLSDLPEGVDPCGENGEFHSFVYAGPNLQKRIAWRKGEITLRDERFYYCDLIPEE